MMKLRSDECADWLSELCREHMPQISAYTVRSMTAELWLGIATDADWIDSDDVRATIKRAYLRVKHGTRCRREEPIGIPFGHIREEQPTDQLPVDRLAELCGLSESAVVRAMVVESATEGYRNEVYRDVYQCSSVPYARRKHRLALEQMRLSVGVHDPGVVR